MESSIFRQIAELAREHKTAARATAVFLCLALVVSAATVGILTYTGHAMTQKVKVLTCPLVVHEHTPACRDAEGNLICGYADYVVHVHNDDCLDENGALVCSLPEVYPHTHDDSCYGEVKTLICGQEEAKGHEHTDECYLRERGELTCTQAEHTHGDACFLREEVLTCSKTEQEHIHTDACYTVSRDLTCGQEEGEAHTHSDACYTETRTLTCDKTTEPHNHGPECYTVNETLICEIPEHTHTDDCYAWTETLICEIPEGQIPEGGHVHTDECYEITEDLICGKLEKHEHTDACFVLDGAGNRTGNPICGQIELLEHVHGEDCFTIEERTEGQGLFFVELFETDSLELTCGKTAHTHDDSCLDENGQLVCGLEEHTHDDSCYSASLTAETPENAEAAETPEDAPAEEAAPVYLCGKEEHTHDDSCLDENGEVVCGLEEHTHSDTCLPLTAETYETLCGKAEHQHSDACLDENGQIACGLEEHVHDASCLAVPDGVFVKTWKDAGTLITARYTAEAQLPEDVTLQAYRVTPESDPARYEDRVESALDALGEGSGAGATMLVYNIGFYDAEGKEVEPLAPVTITIQFLDANGLPTGSPVKVVHFGKDGVTTMDGSTVDGSNSTSFVTDSFSDFSFFLPSFLTDIALIGENDPALTDNGSGDLADFLVDAALKRGNVEIKDGDKVVLGENYTYHVKFQENGDRQFTSPMTFKLPDDFIITPVNDMPVKMNGEDVGTYSIDENGVVTFNFNQNFLDEPNGYVELDLGVTAVDKNGDGHVSLPWAGGAETKFDVAHDPQYKLKKNTELDDWDHTDCTVTYTVDFQVTQGVLYDPEITDAMETGVELAEDADGNLLYKLKVYDETGKDITASLSPQPYLEKTETGWVTRNLPDPMVKGQRVEIKYKAKVDPDTVPDRKNGETPLDFTVDNKATLTGKMPGDKGEIPPRESEKKVHITDELLTKDGSAVAGSDDIIDWTIAVGTGTRDVRGKTIKDTMKEGLYVDTSKQLQIKWKQYPDDTQKRLYLDWTVQSDGKGGWQLDPNSEIANYVTNVKFDEKGNITYFELTTPAADDKFLTEGAKDKPERQWQGGDWFEVEYYTKYSADPSGKVQTYTNHVEGWEDFLPEGIDGTIVVGKGGISKYVNGGKHVQGTGGEAGYIPYSVQIDVPSWEALAGSGAETDSLHTSYGGAHADKGGRGYPRFYVEDELEFIEDSAALNGDTRRYFVQNVPEIDSIVAKAEDGTEYTFYDVTTHPDAEYTYYLVPSGPSQDGRAARDFTIYFNTNMRGKGLDPKTTKEYYHYSQWTINVPTTLTINYKIPDDAGLVIDNGDSATYTPTDLTVRDLLALGRLLRNTADYKVGNKLIDKSSRVDYNESGMKPAIVKQANLREDGRTVDYQVFFRNVFKDVNKEEHIIWAFKEPGSLVFSDTYDSRLEYVPGSLQCTVTDVDGTLRGTFKISDEGKLTFTPSADKTTTTMEAPVGLFDDLQPGYGSIYKRTLLGWLTAYQTEEGVEGHESIKDGNYTFSYQLRIKDDALKPEEMTLDNVANLTFDDQDLKDEENVTVHPDVLDKTGYIVQNGTSNTNKISYTIHVNPGAANMAYNTAEDGQYVDFPAYELEDVMDGGMSLDWTSVTVKGRAAGTADLVVYDRATSRDDVGPGKNTYTLEPLEGKSGFMLYLPDEVEFEITYTAVVDADRNEDVSVVNTVTLHGNTDITEKKPDSFKVQITEATAGAGSSVRLIKRDENDRNKILGGAEFDLYAQSSTGTPTVKAGDNTLGLFMQQIKSSNTFDEYGQYGTVIDAPSGADSNDLYVLVETEAPEGYNKLDKPIVFSFAKGTESSPKTVSVTVNGTTYDDVEIHYVGKDNEKYTLDVYDVAGAFQLPESGGPGSGELYILGGALILASLTLYYTRPRKKESEG